MVNYVYICCPGHSGSTLIDLLLGSHSNIVSLGEISQLPKNIALNTECTCGARVCDCSFWLDVIKGLGQSNNIDILNSPYSLNLGLPRASTVVDRAHQTKWYLLKRRLMLACVYLQQRYGINMLSHGGRYFHEGIANNIKLYDVVRDNLGVNTTVDSSKGYLKGVAVYKRNPLKTRLVLLSRDGRGVMYSYIKRKFSSEDAVHQWSNYYSRALPIIRRNVKNNHWLHVRYEDLAGNPVGELSKICKFLGVKYEGSMLNFASHERHVANGNNMRFSSASEIEPDLLWQKKLTDSDRKLFEKKAGHINRELGYN